MQIILFPAEPGGGSTGTMELFSQDGQTLDIGLQ
jgi:hypothetical protein